MLSVLTAYLIANKNAVRTETDALDRAIAAALDQVVPLGDEKVLSR